MSTSFNFVSWNCRGGITFARKQRLFRSFVSKHNLSIMGLIESKKESFDDFAIRRLWPFNDFDYCFVPSIGASGGLLCIWNATTIKPTRIIKSSRWLSLEFPWCSFVIRFVLVYASNCQRERAQLWDDLLPETQTENVCFLVGDFNEILNVSESLNQRVLTSSMVEFSEFISASSLADFHWPALLLKALPRSFSDHVPLLFNLEISQDWGPKPFKSINAWWSHPDFNDFAAASWASIAIRLPNANLVTRLKKFRQCIKSGNHDTFGDLNAKINSVQLDIQTLETDSETRELSVIETTKLSELYSDFAFTTKQLDSLWFQKLRLNWHLHGDKNSKCFHTMGSVNSKGNFVSNIVVDNICYSEPQEIKLKLHSFFKKQYTSNPVVLYCLYSLIINQLSDAQASSLTCTFTEEEIRSALFNSDDNKAPRPDGFNNFFYKKSWSFMKKDFLDLFLNFHHSGYFPHGLNTAFFVLIPKIKGATDVKDFRPISFINGVFKLLSNVLANRLSPLLPSVISENQFGFIKGRNIHDCHMIASELIHLVKRRKEEIFLIKLDFKKAFDSISWDFILKMLTRMNFGITWINWISGLLKSAQVSVLANGSPSENFYMGKAVEGLKAILEEATVQGLIGGVKVGGSVNPISLLQFADDTLLFMPNDLVAAVLKCKIESLPITYLGLPLSFKAANAKLWAPVMNNFPKKLSVWKGNLLYLARRLVLIKSVLSSLPVYFMCSFHTPKAVLLSLEQCMRKFLWGGSSSSLSFSKVAWHDVRLPRYLGGLNITPLSIKNKSLLYKWIWKSIIVDKTSLWFLLVKNSLEISSWIDLENHGISKLSHFWKGIHNSGVKDDISWLGDDLLQTKFSKLYSVLRQHNVTVSYLLAVDNSTISNFCWLRRLRVGEEHDFRQLQSLLSSAVVDNKIESHRRHLLFFAESFMNLKLFARFVLCLKQQEIWRFGKKYMLSLHLGYLERNDVSRSLDSFTDFT
ncbi:uncharacterized protein LOC126672364 [Mercurialis annua]|uniref:uncharacterized protein LOC126672364 n=1 Tax=Mercurialis annua TaxID=3986 RepID=UPI00215FF09A|nr:uncharacterized protein LOC126672364 [Mercurialis annua]